MKLLFVNPNSTESMTQKVHDTAVQLLPTSVIVESVTNAKGPASIQGEADGIAAVGGMLECIEAGVEQGANGVVIACFDDTGLSEARQRVSVPVIGIGQAAYHYSMLLGHTFSVVTTLSVSIPVLEKNILDYGIGSNCCAVRASEVPVLDLEKPGSNAEEKVSEEIEQAIKRDGCEAIVLGCAGMTDLAQRLAKKHQITVIDGVAAAAGLVYGVAQTHNALS